MVTPDIMSQADHSARGENETGSAVIFTKRTHTSKPWFLVLVPQGNLSQSVEDKAKTARGRGIR